jgi:putative membrane protein
LPDPVAIVLAADVGPLDFWVSVWLTIRERVSGAFGPLQSLYLWLKAGHIAAFAAWMAGMWYLPRLMVYHADVVPGSDTSEIFKVMERRLLRAITTPAMLATWLFGLALAATTASWAEGWLHAKLALVLALTATHGVLAAHVRRFAQDQRPRPARWYRMVNEIPTVLFLAIVILVVMKPF